MSPFDREKARKGLEASLRRLRAARARFEDSPAKAMGYFLEGPGDAHHPAFFSRDAAARFLGLPRGRVVYAQPHSYACPPRPHSGPYCVYLPDDESVSTEDATASLDRQVTALRPIFGQLVETVSELPKGGPAARLAEGISSWWEALFHLAVHFPTHFLEAGRGRWSARTDGPPPLGESYLAEGMTRFCGGPTDFADVVPGVTWVGLRHDVYASTEAAVESLVAYLTEPPPERPRAVVHESFAGLHARFAALAGHDPWPGGPRSTRPRLIKFASTFTTGPTSDWCDFPMATTFNRLPLARSHADAEYLVHRGNPREEADLWAEAGAALPPSIGDAALMFSTAELNEFGGYSFGVGCGTTYLNPDPAARWVRFVLNALRGDQVEVRWRDKPVGHVDFGRPLYGDAGIACDFARASALAIERAGLLAPPRVTPQPPPSVNADSAPTVPPAVVTRAKPKTVRKPKPLTRDEKRVVDFWECGAHDGTYKGAARELKLGTGGAKMIKTLADRIARRRSREARRSASADAPKPSDG